jgi:hypothetical protein
LDTKRVEALTDTRSTAVRGGGCRDPRGSPGARLRHGSFSHERSLPS